MGQPFGATVNEWPGACPVDCCAYGSDWIAREDARAFKDADGRDEVFTIASGDVVRAMTGTLYTIERGRARVDEDFSTDASYADFSARHRQTITFRAGDTIELLAPRGPNVFRIEHNGKVIDANLYRVGTQESCGAGNARCAGMITKQPVTRWWVMVLNADKQVGWIETPDRFIRGGSCAP